MDKGIEKRICLLIIALLFTACSGDNMQFKTITKAGLTDKIKGGWAGKMIGVSYGIRFEFSPMGSIMEDPIPWEPEMIEYALRDDDLYGQMCFMSTMGRNQGLKTPVAEIASDFASAQFGLCHANMQARKNILDGIMPPLSGHPKYNMHANDIDFQIESDFIGFINPGMPHAAMLMADSIGRIMAYGDGLYGGMFVSAMHSLAFFETDAKVIVEKALKCIPSESGYAKTIQTVIDGYKSDPIDWRKTWATLQERYGEFDICVPYHPFNIDASLNGAYVTMGLMYGENDLRKTIEITIRCGQDTDCNAANAAAVLGVMHGYDAINETFKSHIPHIDNQPFAYTEYTFQDAVSQSYIFAEENILANGGRMKDDILKVKTQHPRFTGVLEQSFPDKKPKYQVTMTDKDQYTLTGDWEDYVNVNGDDNLYKVSTKPGDVFEMKFKGTGITVKGRYDVDGGTAIAYIDGKQLREFNCYHRGADCATSVANRYHLVHSMELEDGEHVIKIEVLDKKNPNSNGNRIYIERTIVYENN